MAAASGKLKRILYIEDDAGLARLFQKHMARAGFEADTALDAATGYDTARNGDYQLILIDYHLPDGDGLALNARLTALPSCPPVIILTSSGDERIAIEALEQGVADYVVKDTAQLYINLLPAVMQAAYTRDRLMRENEAQRDELALARDRAEAANRAKSEFLATMSHEIRTPMNAVVGLATLLTGTPLNDKQNEMVATLRTNADVLLKLIDNLLDFSRIEAGQVQLEFSVFVFADLLKEIHAMFSLQMAQKNLGFTIDDRTGGASFRGDRTRVQQIMLNLLGNALKFTDHGGITLTVERVPLDDGASMIHARVADTGIGIAPAHISYIFEKFTQADQSISRRFGGSGLGLAISQRLSKLMGGDITVTSQEGEGSTFTASWRLEDVDAPARAPASAAVAASAALSERPRVLLVEDYPANVLVATLMLENLGYEVDAVSSGPEAVERVAASPAAFAVILMDVQMNGMDGYETTRQIRRVEQERGFCHTIIGVTAHALAGDRERCINAGMDDYMTKPIHPDMLAQKMDGLYKAL